VLTIRDVEPADVAAVRDVLVTTWHATYDPIFGAEKVTEITDNWHSLANLTRQIGLAGAVFLLAEKDGQVIATSYAAPLEDGSVMLRRLYVVPSAQRCGTGQALLDATIARFPDARRVRLEVEPENVAAIRFYNRNGFGEVGKRGCDGSSDVSATLMEKVLKR
jgi:ribosomal protein S18 acetylase RimI-like enzyme